MSLSSQRIWAGTKTVLATGNDRELAGRALRDLSLERLQVTLVPAPDPHYVGHKIRVAENKNPKWYREFVAGHWDVRGCQIKKVRIVRALERVHTMGRIRGNGYEARPLKVLRDLWEA